MHLTKLHATGNDFLVTREVDPGPAAAAALCDRHTGIGADGLIVLVTRGIHDEAEGGERADVAMILRNADGGVAEMSGNGIRCLAWAAVADGFTGDVLRVDTGGGRRNVELTRDASGALISAVCDMGPVTFDPELIPVDEPSALDLDAHVDGLTFTGDAAGMGNPHFVVFVDDVDTAPVQTAGPEFEVDPRFPRRTNVEFAQVLAPDVLKLRIWERGVGETLSCGTGACATAAVAKRRDLVGDRVQVLVPGGVLDVELGETIRLGGPVRYVFDAEIDVDAVIASASMVL